MKTTTLLLLGVAGFALYEYSQLGVAAGTVQFVFSGVQVKSLTDYLATILVQNVSNANIQLNSMALNLSVNGNPIGSASVFPQTPIIIQGNTQQPVNVEVTPSIAELPGAIADLLNNSGGTLNFRATGYGNVNNIPFPIDISKSLSV